MNEEALKILLIEDNLGDARLINEMINDVKNCRCSIDHAFRLSTGLDRLEKSRYDVILLDLGLPDTVGLSGLIKVHEAAPNIPIVIMTGLEDEETAVKAMQMGAQDYLLKLQIESHSIVRTIRYAIERKKNEEKLRAANASKDKFLSIISHDLKSPFQGLLGISEALAKEYSTMQEHERIYYAEAMHNTIRHMNKLIDNVLQWSRLETDKFPCQPQELDLINEVHYALGVLETRFINKKIRVENNIEPEIRAFADADMFQSVMQNLITNAIKFSREGSLISIYSFESEDGQAGIAVKDNGIGMKAEDLNNIFRIDVRISRTGTNDEKGTGLGLIICREMVEKQGGRIWAESRPGEGSTFMFTLPRVRNS